MQVRKIFRAVRPFLSAVAVLATAAALVFAIYFTELGTQWTTFLAGILVAAILAEATRLSRAEWVVLRRTAQLASLKSKFEHEMQLRKIAEEALAASKPRLHLIDEVLPVMVAFIDIEGRCQYHNRAFMDWLHLRPEQIDGRHMREVLGANVYQETATAIRQSLDGHPVHYEWKQQMPDGAIYLLSVEHLPQLGEDGKVTGFFMLIKDITGHSDVHTPARPESTGAEHAGNDVPASVRDGEVDHRNMLAQSLHEQTADRRDTASQIMAAIKKNEFCLFCQLITPLAVDSGGTEHYEILVRLREEEEGLMPPGEFFPLVEKYGLMPHLDRWVVQHVVEWASRQNSPDEKRARSMFFINVSAATIGDPGFPEFLQLTLLEYGVPGTALCFEIPNSELALRAMAVAEFARQVRQRGCRVAISGFGRERILFDMIRGFQVEFLKIDGSIIFNMLRDPAAIAKAMSISGVAKKIGVKTVAELVESEETIAKLREIGIDFAQGFGISRPRLLAG